MKICILCWQVRVNKKRCEGEFLKLFLIICTRFGPRTTTDSLGRVRLFDRCIFFGKFSALFFGADHTELCVVRGFCMIFGIFNSNIYLILLPCESAEKVAVKFLEISVCCGCLSICVWSKWYCQLLYTRHL